MSTYININSIFTSISQVMYPPTVCTYQCFPILVYGQKSCAYMVFLSFGSLIIVFILRMPCVLFLEDQLPPGFPTIDMGPQLKVVERSRTATMLCAASGNPDPEITWFKDFLPVNTSSNNGRIKQLRSGNRPLLPVHIFTFPLCHSAFSSPRYQLPLQQLLFVVPVHPFSFSTAVLHSSRHGYWLRLSAAAVI